MNVPDPRLRRIAKIPSVVGSWLSRCGDEAWAVAYAIDVRFSVSGAAVRLIIEGGQGRLGGRMSWGLA